MKKYISLPELNSCKNWRTKKLAAFPQQDHQTDHFPCVLWVCFAICCWNHMEAVPERLCGKKKKSLAPQNACVLHKGAAELCLLSHASAWALFQTLSLQRQLSAYTKFIYN